MFHFFCPRLQYAAILAEQPPSISKGFILWKVTLFYGTQRVIPSGQVSAILPARVGNHSLGFGTYILPTHRASHIKDQNTALSVIFI